MDSKDTLQLLVQHEQHEKDSTPRRKVVGQSNASYERLSYYKILVFSQTFLFVFSAPFLIVDEANDPVYYSLSLVSGGSVVGMLLAISLLVSHKNGTKTRLTAIYHYGTSFGISISCGAITPTFFMLPFIKDYLGGAFAMDVVKSLAISIVVGLSLATAIFGIKAKVLTEKCAIRALGTELVDTLSPRFRLPAWFFATTLEDDEGEEVA